MEQIRRPGRTRIGSRPDDTSSPRPPRALDAPLPPATPAWQLVLRALQELAGAERGVFYDVPRNAAPRRIAGTPVFLDGSPEWQRFLDAREQMDDGRLTLLLALRSLDETERLLAVDWGNTYANAFLLVEPRDPGFDLTDPANAGRRAVEQMAARLLDDRRADQAGTAPWTRATPLGASLRAAYGVWTVWSSTPPGSARQIGLQATGPEETLAGAIWRHLRSWFPQEAFERTLARLYEREQELFSGRAVERARIPFLTRLGLPVLHQERHVDRALRALVNEGRIWVYERGPDARAYRGPAHPVPDEMPEDEFARLVM